MHITLNTYMYTIQSLTVFTGVGPKPCCNLVDVKHFFHNSMVQFSLHVGVIILFFLQMIDPSYSFENSLFQQSIIVVIMVESTCCFWCLLKVLIFEGTRIPPDARECINIEKTGCAVKQLTGNRLYKIKQFPQIWKDTIGQNLVN